MLSPQLAMLVVQTELAFCQTISACRCQLRAIADWAALIRSAKQ